MDSPRVGCMHLLAVLGPMVAVQGGSCSRGTTWPGCCLTTMWGGKFYSCLYILVAVWPLWGMGGSWSTHLVSEWFLCSVGGAQVAPDWLCVSFFKGMVGLCVVAWSSCNLAAVLGRLGSAHLHVQICMGCLMIYSWCTPIAEVVPRPLSDPRKGISFSTQSGWFDARPSGSSL